LSFFLNVSRVTVRLMSVGRAFHRRAAAHLVEFESRRCGKMTSAVAAAGLSLTLLVAGDRRRRVLRGKKVDGALADS